LGLNDVVSRSSPVQVGALTDWYLIAAGKSHSLAIKSNGTLWSWGLNNRGQLGVSTGSNTSSPVQVGALTDWVAVFAGGDHSLAKKANGTLWAWGYNGQGQLGQNDTANRSSPTQIGALTTWSQVGLGNTTSFGISASGALFAWGGNEYGNLGLNTPYGTNVSSPTQVGALTTWAKVTGGINFTLAIKVDGTLWSWGKGTYGSLGQNNAITRSSPVQVGSLTSWYTLATMSVANSATALTTP
jgi:alpha-tubulin suppressor-like RCC1 family protein